MRRTVWLLGAVAVVSGVSTAQGQATSAAMKDPAGVYDFEATTGQGKLPGRMVIRSEAGGYTGTVAPDGQGVGQITSVTVSDTTVVVVADLGEGNKVTINLRPAPADSLNGRYELTNGQTGEVRCVRIRR